MPKSNRDVHAPRASDKRSAVERATPSSKVSKASTRRNPTAGKSASQTVNRASRRLLEKRHAEVEVIGSRKQGKQARSTDQRGAEARELDALKAQERKVDRVVARARNEFFHGDGRSANSSGASDQAGDPALVQAILAYVGEMSSPHRETIAGLILELSGADSAEAPISGDASDRAKRLRWLLPDAKSPVTKMVGPVLRTPAVEAYLGRKRAAIWKAAVENRLLRLVSADGVSLYPEFQFTSGRTVVPGLKETLDALSEGTKSHLTWAQYLVTPLEDDAQSPIQKLHAGRIAEVVEDARETAASWAN